MRIVLSLTSADVAPGGSQPGAPINDQCFVYDGATSCTGPSLLTSREETTALGSTTLTQQPEGTGTKATVPSCRRTTWRTIARPSPAPGEPCCALLNLSKTRSLFAGGTPAPSSLTSTTTELSGLIPVRTVTLMLPAP